MENLNLKGYTNYTILKNVSNPVMFMGLPLKLSMFYLGAIVISVIIAMILGNIGIGLLPNLLIPGAIAFISITAIRNFYKKYGLHGYYLSKRDRSISNEIVADKSILTILQEQKNKRNNVKS